MTKSLLAGLTGAIALTLLNETLRRYSTRVPRLDLIGKRSMKRELAAVGLRAKGKRSLYRAAIAQDLVGNGLFYGLLSRFRGAPGIGGALAGLALVFLAPHCGLGRAARGFTDRTKMMTVAYYLLGGLAAGGARRALA